MRRIFKGALMAVTATAAMLVPAANAAADVGDGTLACVRGEICFQEIYTYMGTLTDGSNPSGSGLKHYWESDMDHRNNAFHNTGWLLNNIEGWANRDTACSVAMFDTDPTGWWFIYKTLPRDVPTWYYDMGQADWSDTSNYSARNRNDGHRRC